MAPKPPSSEKDLPRFKNTSGVFYTQSLFFETSNPPRPDCVYTLKRYDHNGYPSIRRLYLEEEDPTGYLFAEKHLGGWDHLQKLMELPWFTDHFSQWEKELELKLKAKALARLLKESESKGSRNYVEVNKFLLNRGWRDPGEKKARGAPTKAEIKQAAITIANHDQTVSSELLRVMETGSVN